MFKRTALMTALLVAPLALSPASADAQEPGTEPAAASADNGLATSAENGRPTAMPPGMEHRTTDQHRAADEPLPPGILLTRDDQTETPSGGEEEECLVGFELIDGSWKLVDCEGNVIG